MIHSFFLRLYLCKKTILYLLDKHSIHDNVLAVNIEYIQFLNCIDFFFADAKLFLQRLFFVLKNVKKDCQKPYNTQET